MIGLDTNVVVRYLAQDDPQQSALASEVVDGLTVTAQGFLSLVTVVEVYWVLRRAYQVDAPRCGELIAGLLDARELVVGDHEIVRAALATPAEFADAVIAELGRAAGCVHTLTFDRRAAGSTSMRLLTADGSGPGR